MKRNEQKASDAHGEPKAMRMGSSSTNVELTSIRISNEPLSTSGDISCQTSYPNNESRYSSPITSPYPYEVTQVQPFEPVSVDIDPASVWVSPDLILDSSRVYITCSGERKIEVVDSVMVSLGFSNNSPLAYGRIIQKYVKQQPSTFHSTSFQAQ